MDSIELQQSRLGKIIVTEVVPYSQFYLAEDYHQKYYLRGEEALFNEFQEMYPDSVSLIQSTAAARVNGYLGGYGSPKALEQQLDSFGLSPSGKVKLRQEI